MKLNQHIFSSLLCSVILYGCSEPSPSFYSSENPARLSEWNLFKLTPATLEPRSETLVFKPNNTLFSDYAHKLRTMWIPNGETAHVENNEIVYPAGTVLSKTFYYPVDSDGIFLRENDKNLSSLNLTKNRLIETRLLVKRDEGWQAFPYVWNVDQTEAFLRVAGTSRNIQLSEEGQQTQFTYFVPNENQCSACHVTEHPYGEMHPLGAIANQLTAKVGDTNQSQQIEKLISRNWLEVMPSTKPSHSWADRTASVEQRAASYLNMHCGHCHNKDGAADTSALLLDGSHDLAINMGVCKTPVAAGGGAGDKRYSIVPGSPEESILIYRMLSDQPDEMMPELGRSLVHEEGIELIHSWIEQMQGSCPNIQ